MDLIDISRPLAPTTAVWPGDQPVEWSWTARRERGSPVNLGALRLSTHAGTHADAPVHVQEGGATTDAFSLSVFVGPSEVIDVRNATTIRPDHVREVTHQRILFRTSASSLSADEWPDAVTPIHPDTVACLADQDVVLLGTDAPSVDPLESKALSAHHALIEAGIVNLEGLDLSDVDSGLYGLLALPLNLSGADAAPVRAVLSVGDDLARVVSHDGA
jgi:arylformamidase